MKVNINGMITIHMTERASSMKCIMCLSAKQQSTSDFKAQIRQRLDSKNWVSLTVGDQWGDVRSPGRAQWIKLPDKHDRGLHMSLPHV